MKRLFLRPANSQNVEAIDQTIRLLSESLHWARQTDEKRAVEAVFAALRAAKGARQHLNRRVAGMHGRA